MQDLNNIQTQLAQEEAAQAAAKEQIQAAQAQIEEARRQITAIQAGIEAAEQNIGRLEAHSQAIEKRIALLREYLEMAKTAKPPPAAPAPAAAAGPLAPDETGDLLPSMAPEGGGSDDLEFDKPLIAPTDGGKRATTERGPVTFENLDEDLLTSELLPRTTTFDEELLLVMAYYRKALKPKDIANRFRRLDYASKQSATEKTIKAQIETNNHCFEYVADGRVALTREGREEAQQLLESLL